MTHVCRRTVLALALSFLALPALPQQRAEVMVLGVYHMDNPGHDIFNTKADDVLSPKRQAEMAQVIAVLKEFRPTKIALEGDVSSDRLPKRYAEYVAGKHELTRNEIEQIGFRLAKEMGHATVYPVDVDGEFQYLRVQNYAKASGHMKEWEAIAAEVGAMVKKSNEYLASHTILEMLLHLNSDAKIAEDVGYYYREAEFGEAWDWAGADFLTEWFRRNMRIYSNVARITAPTDRVLVLYGSGHLGWLQHDFASNPRMRLRKLAEFVK